MRACHACGGTEHVVETRRVAMKIGVQGDLQVAGLTEVQRCTNPKCPDPVFLPFVWEHGDIINLVRRVEPPKPQKGAGDGKGNGAAKKNAKKQAKAPKPRRKRR